MGFIAARTKNLVRRTRGMIGRLPRIVNMDKTPALEIIGYVEVNKNATTPFSRGKVHKGFFCCGKAGMNNGDLILDRGDDSYYFVMDKKVEIYRGEEVYVDATMYRCDSVVSVQRFGVDTAKDSFGRAMQSTPSVVHTGAYAMFNPMNFDIKEQQDRVITDNKIKLCLQSKFDVRVADRIITEAGNKYHVTSVDNESLQGLVLYTVDTDVR